MFIKSWMMVRGARILAITRFQTRIYILQNYSLQRYQSQSTDVMAHRLPKGSDDCIRRTEKGQATRASHWVDNVQIGSWCAPKDKLKTSIRGLLVGPVYHRGETPDSASCSVQVLQEG